MDRAEKVKRYRKIKQGNSRQILYLKDRQGWWIRLGAAGLSVICFLAVLFVTFHHKKQENGLEYVSEDEFASLLSFLVQDVKETSGKAVKDAGKGSGNSSGKTSDKDTETSSGGADEAQSSRKPEGLWQEETAARPVTRGKLKQCIQQIGLSQLLPVTGGSGKVSRENVMDYYSQILDYLDLDGAVRKKNILLLEQSAGSCETDKGTLAVKADFLELESFQVYEAYIMDKTLLGIHGISDQAAVLKDVMIDSVTDGQIYFEYKGKGYQLSCKDTDGLSENTNCTLQIKNKKAVSIRDISQPESSESKPAVKTEAAAAPAVKGPVRVLLLNQGAVHYDQLYLTCDGNWEIKQNKKKKSCKKDDFISTKQLKIKNGTYITAVPQKEDSRLFFADAGGSKISNGYYGKMEIYKDADGYYVVNEVDVEKYLYSVVASEMPSSFAPEALKAQAVCARSYVYRQMASGDYNSYHAQIDDSTNYQVYNRSAYTKEDVEAVAQTAGEVMYAGNEIVNAYYFSASCGYTSGMEIWNQKDACPYLKAKVLKEKGKTADLSKEEAFRKYITSMDKEVFDSDSPYFRWTARAEFSGRLEELKQCIQSRQTINPDNITYYATVGKKEKKVSSLRGFGGVKKMYCGKRSKSGAVLNLVICFEYGMVEIRSEYNIRSILGCALEQVRYADGREDTGTRFLPSAYVSISFDKKSGRYILTGGGNGHGMGMSQYAADGMGERGWDYKKILAFFYDGIQIKKVG